MFTTLISSKLAALGVAGALTLGVFGGGVAYASHNSAGNDPTPAAFEQVAKERPEVFKNLLADIIKQSGLSKDAFKQGFKDGQSINQTLTANSKSPEDVKTAVHSDVDARIDQAVTNGKITAQQAEKLHGRVGTVLDRLFAAAPKQKPGTKVLQLAKHELDLAAQTIGVDTKTLVQDLRNGETIAQVAGDKTPAVITALTNDANSAIDKALADGKITQQQHDKLESNVGTRVTNFVNNPHPGRQKGQ